MDAKKSKRQLPAKHLSRRRFFALALLAGFGVGAAALDRISQPIGIRHTMTWIVRGNAQRLVGQPSIVALGKCTSYGDDIRGCLEGLWTAADMPDVRGKRVLVKPNLIDYIDGYPITTAAEVVGAVDEPAAERMRGQARAARALLN